MTAEEAIKDLQNKKPPTKQEVVRRNWSIGIVLTLSTVLAMITTLYALVQQVEAKKQAEIAIQVTQKNMELQQELRITMEEANRQRMIAEEQRLIAIKTLEDCKSSQKKK